MRNCRLCNSEIELLFVIPNACPNISFLPLEETKDKAKDLDVYICSNCDLVQLSEDDKNTVAYDEYFMATSGSEQMQECQANQSKLIKEYSSMYLKGREPLVLEVGCGDGSFLKHLIKEGFDVEAIEPSKVFYEHAIKVTNRIKNQYMSYDISDKKYDIIIAREVLEHIYDFTTFIKQIKSNLSPGGLVMIQVPRLETVIKYDRMHTFFTDHVNYFSEKTLSLAFKIEGFEILHTSSYMDGEYTVLIARKNKKLGTDYRLSFDNWRYEVMRLLNFIESQKKENKKVLLWGAGGKGLSIISAMRLSPDSQISLVDCDKMKIGRYTPVSNFYINDSSSFDLNTVDSIVILADAYRKEIMKKIENRDFKGRVVYFGCDSL